MDIQAIRQALHISAFLGNVWDDTEVTLQRNPYEPDHAVDVNTE